MEALFKANRKDNNYVVEGFYTNLFDEKEGCTIPMIHLQCFESASMDYPYPTCQTISAEVKEETVCQFTGTVLNKVKVFDKDHIRSLDGGVSWVVFWSVMDLQWKVKNSGNGGTYPLSHPRFSRFEVVNRKID